MSLHAPEATPHAAPSPTTGTETVFGRDPRRVAMVAVVMSAVFAVINLGHKSLWIDEGYTIGHTRLPWDDFWHLLTNREVNGALHSLLMFGWVRVHHAEWWMRLPSAVFAVATVAFAYLLLARLFDGRVGAIAALLLSGNAFFVEHAQEARTYALMALLATMSTYFLVRVLQADDRTGWVGWLMTAMLLPYSQYYGLLVLLAQFVGVFALRRGLPTDRRRLFGGFALIGVASLPLLVFVAVGGDTGQTLLAPGATPVRFIGVFARLAGNGGVPLMVAAAISALYGLFATLGTARARRLTEEQWGALLLACWLVLPVVFMAVLTPVKPLFAARYFLIGITALVGLVALGLARMPASWWRNLLGATIAVLTLVALVGWYVEPAREEVRQGVAIVAENAEPGDGIVFSPWFMEVPFDTYASENAAVEDDVTLLWPAADWGRLVEDYRDQPFDAIYDDVASRERVWVVTRDDRTPPDDETIAHFEDALDGHRLVLTEDLNGLDVRLYERR